MKNSKSIKIIAIVLAIVVVLGLGTYAGNTYGYFEKGNNSQYAVKNCTMIDDSNLEGKKIIFLGSSVTYGFCSHGESFVDFLAAQYGIVPVKEAKSGTTLVDNGKNSYVSRMKTIKETNVDAFVCQLSTNDATKEMPLGTISDGFDMKSFDTSTIAGAIEYIIAYAKDTWDCPVIFFTNTKYDDDNYEDMVNLLLDIQAKWNIGVIDLWNNEDMHNLSFEKYQLYMADKIHPTRAGYRDWWTPVFKEYLEKTIG